MKMSFNVTFNSTVWQFNYSKGLVYQYSDFLKTHISKQSYKEFMLDYNSNHAWQVFEFTDGPSWPAWPLCPVRPWRKVKREDDISAKQLIVEYKATYTTGT